MYADKGFDNALQQSMVAEFSLAYDDIATALHNYTVLAIRSNSTTIKQRALDVALEYNDFQSALDIATHWVEQEPKDVPALFYLSHIALKTHEYELAAKTLDKILNIDPTADLEQILAGIAPEQAQDREILLNALHKLSNGDFNVAIYDDIGIFNSLGHEFSNIKDSFEKAGVDPMARPETLSLADFVALSDQMVP
jgi:tetratricopeptide (TPR) repeat protein